MSRALRVVLALGCAVYLFGPAPVRSQAVPPEEELLRVLEAQIFAQGDQHGQRDDSGPGHGPGGPYHGRRDEPGFGKHVEQFRMLKLLELLDLREDQEVEFITLFHRMRSQQRELRFKRVAVLEMLSDGLQPGEYAEVEVARAVRQLLQESRNEIDLRENFLKDAGNILTPIQLGRLILFQERFELELLGAVRAFRERMAERRKELESSAADSLRQGENE